MAVYKRLSQISFKKIPQCVKKVGDWVISPILQMKRLKVSVGVAGPGSPCSPSHAYNAKSEDRSALHHNFLLTCSRTTRAKRQACPAVGRPAWGARTDASDLLPWVSQLLTQVPFVFQEPPLAAPKSSSLQRRPRCKSFC